MTSFVVQKLWEREGKHFAHREIKKAKAMAKDGITVGLSWKERLFGKNVWKPVHYRLNDRKLVMF